MNSLLDYAFRTGRFENLFSNSSGFQPVVAPGMAVKLYADRHAKSSPYLDTSDLDITVYMRHPPKSVDDLRKKVAFVYRRFDRACEDYARFVGAKLVKRCPGIQIGAECPVSMTRKQGKPYFDRNVYAFKKYLIETDKEHELMDVVVVYQPDVPFSDMVNRRIRFGLPVPKVKYLIQELVSMVHIDILGTSPFNQKRHPVTGKESLKGVKDLHRLQYILTLSRNRDLDSVRKWVRHLLNILRTDYSESKKSSRMREVLLNAR